MHIWYMDINMDFIGINANSGDRFCSFFLGGGALAEKEGEGR